MSTDPNQNPMVLSPRSSAVASVGRTGTAGRDWDWFGYRPDPPHVLGHEPTGRIVATGEDVETVEEGQEIAIPFNFACGTCDICVATAAKTSVRTTSASAL